MKYIFFGFLLLPVLSKGNETLKEQVEWAGLLDLTAGTRKCIVPKLPLPGAVDPNTLECPKELIVRKIFERADKNSKFLGVIKVTIKSIHFNPTLERPLIEWEKPDGSRIEFKSDDLLEDSLTYIGCQNGWIKLPRNPFPTPVWLQTKSTQCIPVTGFDEIKLKWNLIATEVGTNRKVFLPKGKIVQVDYTEYKDGRVALQEMFRKEDFPDDHPVVKEALKEKLKSEKMNSDDIKIFLRNFKEKLVINHYGSPKAVYEIPMDRFLDENLHLPLEKAFPDDVQVPTRYLDEKQDGPRPKHVVPFD